MLLNYFIGLLLVNSLLLSSLSTVSATGKVRAASAWVLQNPGSSFCSIADLQLSGGAVLKPSFKHYQKTYTCSCPTGQKSVNVKVTLGQSDGITKILLTTNGSPFQQLNSGQLSNPIPLPSGQTTTITVSTSCDICNEVYTIKCDGPPTTPPPGTGGSEQPPPPPPGTGGSEQPPPPPPGVVGDPMITGLRNQHFQVHGVANEVYNLVSTPHMQMNSRFVFLDKGKCPVVDGVTIRGGCYSHPGSYLGEIAVKTSVNDRIHIVSGAADVGFSSVKFNDRELNQGDVIELKTINSDYSGWVSRNNTHTVTLSLSKFEFVIHNSDMFVNQAVGYESIHSIAAQSAHGLLGQTWSGKEYKGSRIKEIEGNVDDYRAPEQDLWSDEFLFNRFGKE